MKKLNSLKPNIIKLDTSLGKSMATKRIRGWALTKIIKRISERDGYRCQICGRVTVDGEVDHKTPLHLGGAESDANRWLLCVDCHRLKTEREEKERGNV
jgi:5-methylcytosine-specific restriction protein A